MLYGLHSANTFLHNQLNVAFLRLLRLDVKSETFLSDLILKVIVSSFYFSQGYPDRLSPMLSSRLHNPEPRNRNYE